MALEDPLRRARKKKYGDMLNRGAVLRYDDGPPKLFDPNGDLSGRRPYEDEDKVRAMDNPYSRSTSQAPTGPANDPNDYRSKLKPRPTFDVNGVVDPKYKTGRGSNALAGASVGAQIGAQRNDPIFGIGATIGGMVAGLFKKNLAGKMQHQADVQEADEYNKELYASTMADERIQAMEQQADLRQKEQARKQQDSERAEQWRQNKFDYQKIKDSNLAKDKKSKAMLDFASKIPDPEQKSQIVSDALTLMEVDHDPTDPKLADYANKIETTKAGDFIIKTDQWGNFVGPVTGKDGNPINTQTRLDQIKVLKELIPKEEEMNIGQALDQADGFIKKHFNGQMKDLQRSNLKMQVAKIILAEGKDKAFDMTLRDREGKNYIYSMEQLGTAPKTEVPQTGTQPTEVTQPVQSTTQAPAETSPKAGTKTPEQYVQGIDPKDMRNEFADVNDEISRLQSKQTLTPEEKTRFNVLSSVRQLMIDRNTKEKISIIDISKIKGAKDNGDGTADLPPKAGQIRTVNLTTGEVTTRPAGKPKK